MPFLGEPGKQTLVYNKAAALEHSTHIIDNWYFILGGRAAFAEHYANGIMPQFVEERLIHGLSDLPPNSDLPLIGKLIIGDANRR